MRLFQSKSLVEKLDDMLDQALKGTFEEEVYDESQVSRLESKWMRYLTSSERALRRAADERAGIKELVTDISHQTKTPLSNIMLYSQLLQEQVQDQESRRLAEQIKQQSEKLQFLIETLIKTSRLETGTFQIKPEKNRICAAAEDSIRQVKKKAADKNIAIENKADGELTASFDRKWTTEAFFNILDNAVKYSSPGSRIQVSADAYEIYVAVKFRDQGKGISQEEIPKIFGRFYRGQEVQQEEGIGIGLYLSRQIIEAQSGYITVHSKPGKGSEFQVYLLR